MACHPHCEARTEAAAQNLRPGSIIWTLYTNANITGSSIEHYLHIADDMICRSATQCDTERAGSNMNLIKTKKRMQLGDEVYSDLVFLSFNQGWLHETDVKLLVEAWKESDHKLQINQNDADSIVLGRLRSRDSHDHGFFLKEASPFKPTDLRFSKTNRANPAESQSHPPPNPPSSTSFLSTRRPSRSLGTVRPYPNYYGFDSPRPLAGPAPVFLTFLVV